MAFDATLLTAVLDEIRTKAAAARIDKIHQPSRDTLILHLKCQEGRQKLIFVANPTAPRLHLTTSSPENPAEPPMFCMLLRKHSGNGRIVSLEQQPLERVVRLDVEIITQKLTVKVRGPYGEVMRLTPQDLRAEVDFTGAQIGSSTFKVVITFGDTFQTVGVVGTCSAGATVSEAAEE